MVVAVVAVAALGTRATGAPAALSAAAWFDFFLTRPYQQFAIADGDEIQTAFLLLVVGLIVSQLAARVQRLRTVVVADASHLSSLQGTARLVEDGASPEAVVEYVRRELVGLLGLRGCRFEYGRLLGHRPDGETELRVVGGTTTAASSSIRSRTVPCLPRRPAWSRSRWPLRPVPCWTRSASPTRADRQFATTRVCAALRVPLLPYGPHQGVLTPG
ncbi:DUF4118 domain-containing protein [Streptomyces virginiae]|uniref:DUF4118 domain-containing protein n=1 Tax=Streptomyces virginiae TaxID=1961 RepID=UPI000A5DB215|nr:DUF4118 domain-containing protein [Streptomyces virginiae]